jgi:GTP-binding protein
MENDEKYLPKVVIFGRTNVGKSTLFNKLTEQNKALISGLAGTTRDINIGEVAWNNQNFELADTGGIIEMKKFLSCKKISATTLLKGVKDIDSRVQIKAREVLDSADIILFVVDQKAGLLAQDREIAKFLLKFHSAKKIILAVNKADTPADRREAMEFMQLSLGEPLPISANSGSGTGDLLDEIVVRFPKQKLKKITADKDFFVEEEIKANNDKSSRVNSIKVCLLGQPNVGKSSLINQLVGYERVIVSPVPRTTREPQDIELDYKGEHFILVDTAGLTKRGRDQLNKKELVSKIVSESVLDRFSVHKSMASLNRSDIAILMLDINQTISKEDMKIIEEVKYRKKSLIIVANKWDLVKERNTKVFTKYLRDAFPYVSWAPIQFLSALTGEKSFKLLDLIIEINLQRKKEISDKELERFLSRIVKIIRPMKGRGQIHPRIYELRQIKTNPPLFEIRIGIKQDISPSYLSFIENRMRERYGLIGTPIRIRVIRRQQESKGDIAKIKITGKKKRKEKK